MYRKRVGNHFLICHTCIIIAKDTTGTIQYNYYLEWKMSKCQSVRFLKNEWYMYGRKCTSQKKKKQSLGLPPFYISPSFQLPCLFSYLLWCNCNVTRKFKIKPGQPLQKLQQVIWFFLIIEKMFELLRYWSASLSAIIIPF